MSVINKRNIIVCLLALLILPIFFSGSVVYAEEKVLNLATASEPPTVDPALATDTTSGSVIDNVFETLTKVNKEGEIIPGAAASWDVSEDGTTYTFHLQPEGKWSNGEPVTAKDFEYSWKRLLNPDTGSQRGNLYYVIKGAKAYHEEDGALEEVGIKAVDDHTLEVTLVAPAAYFLEQVSHYAFAPVYQSAVEGNDAWAAEAGEDFVTNGPFVLSEWNHQADYTLTPNEHYWDRDKVKLDKVNVQIVESETTANTAFQAGDFDYIGAPYSTVATDFIQLYKDQDQLNVEPISSIYWYKVNTTDPIMQNVNIRKALASAIDRKQLVEQVTKGEQEPATGIVPSTVKGFEEPRDYFKDNDPEAAKEFLQKGLEELDMKSPEELTIVLSINTSEDHSAIAQFIQQEWSDVLGVNVTIDNSEWQVYLDKVNILDYQVARLGWAGDYNDAFNFLDMYRTKDTPNNQTGWGNDEFTRLMEEASAELDEDKRTQLLLDAEAVMMNDMPVIPIYYYTHLSVQQPRVKNIGPDKVGRINLKEVTVED